jgi:hypothetical protein
MGDQRAGWWVAADALVPKPRMAAVTPAAPASQGLIFMGGFLLWRLTDPNGPHGLRVTG